VLIAGGVLQGFLYDQYSANKDGVRSTGNASRPSLLSPPLPQVSNFYLRPGRDSVDALLMKLGRGVLITDVLGMHTANPVSGDFSVGAAGSWVELGKISHPVKGIAISGNVLTLLSRVAAVGTDLRFFGRVGAPSLLVTELNVGGV
jgi:PmbA protein